ncbi:MAG TPA: hypothetical protein VNS34_04015 [Rhizobiaceae bacterium]|nr:hypothetical protein [Rhizobiaceae bacterium]
MQSSQSCFFSLPEQYQDRQPDLRGAEVSARRRPSRMWADNVSFQEAAMLISNGDIGALLLGGIHENRLAA